MFNTLNLLMNSHLHLPMRLIDCAVYQGLGILDLQVIETWDIPGSLLSNGSGKV